MSLRIRSVTAISVLAIAAVLVGSALAGRSSSLAGPSSSFVGTNSSGSSPSSSFTGTGTLGGSGEGDQGSGRNDSGSLGRDDGSGGTLAIASSGLGPTGMTVAVRQLQTELTRLGYFHHVVTGYYGLVTTAAVKKFQLSADLKPDGIWGPLSEAALTQRLAGT
jgi:hypothetical protein